MAISMQADAFPFTFESTVESISSMSDRIAQGPSGLLTGPQTINCTSPDQPTCFSLMESAIDPVEVTANPGSNILTLSQHRIQRVYNTFIVRLSDWFYDTEAFQTPRNITVEAEGFVFVNVIDEVEISEAGDNEVRVTREWNNAADFVCNPATITRKSLPMLGNIGDSSSSSDDDATLNYGIREIMTGNNAQDPSTHLLVNLRTLVSSNGANLEDEAATACSGLRYRFSNRFGTKGTKRSKRSKYNEDFTIEGTYVLANEMSSLELRDYSWEGGQLITLGAQVNFRWMRMHHGLYLPDESSFCCKTPFALP